MAKIIAVTNQKGGVGKTTIAGNLAYEYSLAGYKTLMIDADPQGSLSGWMSDKKTDLELTDILVEKLHPSEGLIECRNNLFLIKTDYKKNSLREFAQSQLSQELFIFYDLNEALDPLFLMLLFMICRHHHHYWKNTFRHRLKIFILLMIVIIIIFTV